MHTFMKNTKSLNIKALSSQVFQWKETIAVSIAAILIPFLIHMIQATGSTPIGAQLLPMFYVPFLAVLFFRFHVAFIAAAVAPIANTLLLGQPDLYFTTYLTLELLTFTVIAFYLKDWIGLRWVNAPVALILSKIAIGIMIGLLPIEPSIFKAYTQISVAISVGAVGILVLGVLNVIFLSLKHRLN